jgi:hypothetical protein
VGKALTFATFREPSRKRNCTLALGWVSSHDHRPTTSLVLVGTVCCCAGDGAPDESSAGTDDNVRPDPLNALYFGSTGGS